MATHFSNAALKFLKGLARHNDRDWFEARKPVYERELKAPLLALIEEVNQALLQFAPEYVRPPRKIAMRIYRDIRFSANKQPYKTHVSAWWARQGLEKTSGGGFYLELSATELRIAAGCYMPDKEQLLAIRRMLLGRHEEYRAMIGSRRVKELMVPFDGMKMARGPKGFPPDHPAADLIQQRQWGIWAGLPAEAALQPSLPAEVAERFRAAAPLVSLLNGPLVPAARKPVF